MKKPMGLSLAVDDDDDEVKVEEPESESKEEEKSSLMEGLDAMKDAAEGSKKKATQFKVKKIKPTLGAAMTEQSTDAEDTQQTTEEEASTTAEPEGDAEVKVEEKKEADANAEADAEETTKTEATEGEEEEGDKPVAVGDAFLNLDFKKPTYQADDSEKKTNKRYESAEGNDDDEFERDEEEEEEDDYHKGAPFLNREKDEDDEADHMKVSINVHSSSEELSDKSDKEPEFEVVRDMCNDTMLMDVLFSFIGVGNVNEKVTEHMQSQELNLFANVKS